MIENKKVEQAIINGDLEKRDNIINVMDDGAIIGNGEGYKKNKHIYQDEGFPASSNAMC